MRPKICVPIVAVMRDSILENARKIAAMPVQMVEWRADFFAGYERELLSITKELKEIFNDKELIVTLRTTLEGGEPNGSRFDYFGLVHGLLEQDITDYVDVEIERDMSMIQRTLTARKRRGTKVIGSYHDFSLTPSEEFIVSQLKKAKELGCDVGKLACMPKDKEDTGHLLAATEKMKKEFPDFPVITMSMGTDGVPSRLYGGLYGSEVSFGCVGQSSAPGQISADEMIRVFDSVYSGKKHIILIGFMGTGKSTISAELHQQSGRPEVDTDACIVEKEGRSITEIFETEGEPYFRDVETALIDTLGKLPASIISCGGGMALRDLNVHKLQAMGEVVLLTATPETIFERVRYTTSRPILNGNMNIAYIRELIEKRKPYYEKAATIQIATDGRGVSDIAKEILEKCS